MVGGPACGRRSAGSLDDRPRRRRMGRGAARALARATRQSPAASRASTGAAAATAAAGCGPEAGGAAGFARLGAARRSSRARPPPSPGGRRAPEPRRARSDCFAGSGSSRSTTRPHGLDPDPRLLEVALVLLGDPSRREVDHAHHALEQQVLNPHRPELLLDARAKLLLARRPLRWLVWLGHRRLCSPVDVLGSIRAPRLLDGVTVDLLDRRARRRAPPRRAVRRCARAARPRGRARARAAPVHSNRRSTSAGAGTSSPRSKSISSPSMPVTDRPPQVLLDLAAGRAARGSRPSSWSIAACAMHAVISAASANDSSPRVWASQIRSSTVPKA